MAVATGWLRGEGRVEVASTGLKMFEHVRSRGSDEVVLERRALINEENSRSEITCWKQRGGECRDSYSFRVLRSEQV